MSTPPPNRATARDALRDKIAHALAHRPWCVGYDGDGTCTCRPARDADAERVIEAVATLIRDADTTRRIRALQSRLNRRGQLGDREAAERAHALRRALDGNA